MAFWAAGDGHEPGREATAVHMFHDLWRVNVDGGRLSNPGATALSLRRLGVTGRLSCSKGFSAEGEIVLSSARVEGSVDFYLQDWTVGYGYRPFRAVLWLAALLLLGTVVFTVHQPPAFKPGEAPPFNAFLYSLDLLLPIISFGQETAFGPRGSPRWLAAAMITAGWILATTVVAGLTRALSRQ